MSKSEPAQKLKYLPCRVKAHQGEHLNSVCIGCQQAGLICSLCREQHSGHRIIPLKILLHNLSNKLQQPPQDQHYCEHMQKLQNIKNNALLQLRCSVQNLARMFEQVEQGILDSYNQAKIQVIQQIQLGLQIDGLVHGLVAGNVSQTHFQQSIRRLARYVNPSKQSYILDIDFEKTLKPLQKLQSSLERKLKLIEQFVEQHFNQKQILAELKPQIKPVVQNQIYRFSTKYKGKSIVLSQNEMVARQSETASSRFAIIEEGMGIKNRSITFKIVNLKNWIGVGVALRDKISSVDYAFKYENMGHGSFLLSNNGYTWSHFYPEDNIRACLFTFKQDEVVKVTLTEKQLIFKVNNASNEYKLKIFYEEHQWPNVCFCVNLCSLDDTIQILDQ